MNRFILLFAVLCAFILAGCGMEAQTPTPTITPTVGLFIRVSTPTAQDVPTQTGAPILESTPTVGIPTPTPVMTTVVELPDAAGYTWEVVVDGLDNPLGLISPGDGSGRMFVIEQGGLVRILVDGAILPTPFLDLTQQVNCCGERGLLGLAFHPRFVQNGYFYVDYTESANDQLATVIARYSISPEDANQADPRSEMRLLRIDQPYQNHNGGDIRFGPDGYLYIAMGDGGSAGDPLGNGQSLQTLLGKILRIDVDSSAPYAIPADNPFMAGGGMLEIWQYGLRNPWRFTFDSLTSDMYIGDVGQDGWEEINFIPAGNLGGENLGWSFYEGAHPYRGSPPIGTEFVMPVAEYGRDMGNSITGGHVYRGFNLPAWYGVYLYGDFGSGRVWGLLHLPDGSWQNALMYDTRANISSFGVDENGEMYIVDYGGSILILR